jgi:chemotaxis protein MotB
MRRRRPEAHANHERWVISYADFVTLMFALFVAMYAISLKDHTSGKRISESVREAVATGGLPSAVRALMAKETSQAAHGTRAAGQDPNPVEEGSLQDAYRKLTEQLRGEVSSGSVLLHLNSRGLTITLQEKSFFASGEDMIYERTYPTLERVAKIISQLPNPVRLEGHTDSVPISNARFKNNWELSTARSIALQQLLETKFGLDTSRYAVAGYAQNQPVASNGTEDGRARNRRVEIVILAKQMSTPDLAKY